MEQVEVAVQAGRLRGRIVEGRPTFLGVPYAAPPVGERRFAAPQPVEPWQGVRDALEPGPSSPQRASESFAGLDMTAITGAQWRRGDDYLTLNVWAPPRAHSRPVLVWVHGGGLVLGTKDAPVYDGSAFARNGVVTVAMNYRLGVEGFLPVPGAPTNLGLRDVLTALRWVQDNIAAFGGDPGNVTLVGESGGGIAVACLVTSPLSAGLFRRAVVQSGHGSAVYSMDVAGRTVRRVAEVLGVSPDVQGFRSVGPERAVDALRRVSRPGGVDLKDEHGFDPAFGLGVIDPVYGDDVLPVHPLDALRSGAARGVDLLVTTTADEARFWIGPTRLLGLPRWAARWVLGRMTADAFEVFDAYRRQEPGRRGGELLSRILSDLAFRWPARQLAEAHQGRTHVAEFDWPSTAAGGRLGAAHGVDLAFVFDNLGVVTGPRGMAGTHPPQEFADRVHGLWVRYVTDGSLPWPEFDGEQRLVRQLWNEVTVREEIMPAADFVPARNFAP